VSLGLEAGLKAGWSGKKRRKKRKEKECMGKDATRLSQRSRRSALGVTQEARRDDGDYNVEDNEGDKDAD
jgi:hypothetical protein